MKNNIVFEPVMDFSLQSHIKEIDNIVHGSEYDD